MKDLLISLSILLLIALPICWFGGIYPFQGRKEIIKTKNLEDQSVNLKIYHWKNFYIVEYGIWYNLSQTQADSIINKHK